MRPRIQDLKAALRVTAGRAEQVVGNIVARFRAVETEAAVRRADVSLVDLVIAELSAEFHRVPAIDLGETIGEVPRIVRLKCGQRRTADAEIGEPEAAEAPRIPAGPEG